MEKFDIKGTRILFYTNYFTFSTNVHGTLKIEEILNLTCFIVFGFWQLGNIRGTYSEYF